MKDKGMTLIEVMFAMAILALAGLAILNAGSEKLRNLDRLKQQQLAMWSAEDLAIAIRLSGVQPNESVQGENFQSGGMSFYRSWQVRSTTYQDVYQLQIDVSPQENPQQILFSLASWLVKK